MPKQIVFSKKFDKSYIIRIKPNKKLAEKFDLKLSVFVSSRASRLLNDHPLLGKHKGCRAFSVTGDIRVIYEETEDSIIFLDVGTHNQVYK